MINNDLDNNIEVYEYLNLGRIPDNILGHINKYIDYTIDFNTFLYMINISAISDTPYYSEYDK